MWSRDQSCRCREITGKALTVALLLPQEFLQMHVLLILWPYCAQSKAFLTVMPPMLMLQYLQFSLAMSLWYIFSLHGDVLWNWKSLPTCLPPWRPPYRHTSVAGSPLLPDPWLDESMGMWGIRWKKWQDGLVGTCTPSSYQEEVKKFPLEAALCFHTAGTLGWELIPLLCASCFVDGLWIFKYCRYCNFEIKINGKKMG